MKYDALVAKWNILVTDWNAHVREENKKNKSLPVGSANFTTEEIDRLIRLCHPDKHANSTASNEMTKRLLALRN